MKKQYTKVCQNPKCNKQFITEKSNQKYCSDECAKYMHNKQKREKDIVKYKDKPCETCGKEHDHSYGSGRFCSSHCRMVYIANQSKHSPKKLAHLDKIHNLRKKKDNIWKCKECGEIFNTKSKLNEHKHKEHGYLVITKDPDKPYTCPLCGKEFNNLHAVNGHLASCPNHPNKDYHDKAHAQSGITLKSHLKDGTVVHRQTGHPLTKETREKISKSTISRIYDSNHQLCRKDVKYYDIENNFGKTYKVRGTWELNVAKELNRLNIEWDNSTYLNYKTDINRTYHPDFHISNSNIFIEVKGYYPDDDKKKMDAVLKSNPDVDIYFLHSNYERFLNSKMKLFQASTLLSESNVFDDNI